MKKSKSNDDKWKALRRLVTIVTTHIDEFSKRCCLKWIRDWTLLASIEKAYDENSCNEFRILHYAPPDYCF